jgi:hypothetical protein
MKNRNGLFDVEGHHGMHSTQKQYGEKRNRRKVLPPSLQEHLAHQQSQETAEVEHLTNLKNLGQKYCRLGDLY